METKYYTFNRSNMCIYIFYFSHLRNDEVIAAASLNFDPAASAVAERFASGKVITKKEAQYVKSFSFFLLLSFE